MMADEEVTITKSQSTGSSTGAIPKSISFDKTAERGDKVKALFSSSPENRMWVFVKKKNQILHILCETVLVI